MLTRSAGLQILAVTIEGLFLSHLPVANVVPSISIVTLIVIGKNLDFFDVMCLSLVSALLYEAMLPVSGTIALLWFVLAGCIVSMRFAVAHVWGAMITFLACIACKHLVLFVSLFGHVSSLSILTEFCFDVILCAILFWAITKSNEYGKVRSYGT